MAPAEAFTAVPVSPAALRFGIMTPCAPAKFAVRITAPRLCGSSTLSKSTINGGSPFSFAFCKISSTDAYSNAAMTAMAPWCFFVSEIWSNRSFVTKFTTVPFRFASLKIVCIGPSLLCSDTYSLSTVFPERNASNTAFLPSICNPSKSIFYILSCSCSMPF